MHKDNLTAKQPNLRNMLRKFDGALFDVSTNVWATTFVIS
jgi:hypothetical protein